MVNDPGPSRSGSASETALTTYLEVPMAFSADTEYLRKFVPYLEGVGARLHAEIQKIQAIHQQLITSTGNDAAGKTLHTQVHPEAKTIITALNGSANGILTMVNNLKTMTSGFDIMEIGNKEATQRMNPKVGHGTGGETPAHGRK
ncbi:hypothetical protein ACWGJX_38985 [Streptomyces sp. NPDC054775]